MMHFCKFLVTIVAMATFSLYHFWTCDFKGIWQHFLKFLGVKNLFVGSLHSKPLYGLELITQQYLTTNVAMATLFLFLGPV